MDFNWLLTQLPTLFRGIVVTLQLMVLSLLCGLLFALFLTWLSYSRIIFIRGLVYLYTFVIRGTPLLVQMFLIYYGSGQFDLIRDSWLWSILQHPFACAVLALSLNSAGYCVILFRGIIRAIPSGEIEACRSLGMSQLQLILSVMAKRFAGLVMPAYSNEVIIILKSTSLASTIAIMDLMGVTREIIAETYATIPYLIVAGACYLVINLVIIRLFRFIEKKLALV
jgi:arginine transport system permease protein